MANTGRFLALLRGINVGGKNIIKMADLKVCFETMGFSEVTTYIQSGNVVFSSSETNLEKVEAILEAGLSQVFNYHSVVVVLSASQMEAIVEQAPDSFGLAPDQNKYDVVFLKHPLTADQALPQVLARKEVDTVCAQNNVLYFTRTIANLGKSYLSKVVSLPLYKHMTIRNWNTTVQLLKLVRE